MVKIKKFSKEYIAKILRKLEKSGQRRKGSTSNVGASSSRARFPNFVSPHPELNGHDLQDSPDDAMDIDDFDGTHENPDASPHHTWSRPSSDPHDSHRNDSWRDTQASPLDITGPSYAREDSMKQGNRREHQSRALSTERWVRSERGQVALPEASQHNSEWNDVRVDPRIRRIKDDSSWDQDLGDESTRSLLERIQPL